MEASYGGVRLVSVEVAQLVGHCRGQSGRTDSRHEYYPCDNGKWFGFTNRVTFLLLVAGLRLDPAVYAGGGQKRPKAEEEQPLFLCFAFVVCRNNRRAPSWLIQ